MLGEPITEAKISVPSIFDAAQKKATLNAAESSHLFEKVDIMTEPIATAFACRDYYKVIGENDQKLMVVDIGAGTTDIEIIDVSDEIFEVDCRTGDPELGGDNIDEEIVKYLKEEFKKQLKEQGGDVDLIDDGIVNKNLKREAEFAKIALDKRTGTDIFVEIEKYFLSTTLTRDKLEELISTDTDGKESIITRIRKEIRRALDESGLKKEDISKVAYVGGPTNMPIIRELVKEEVGGWEEKVDPFTCVAIGAAHSGLVIDITPFSYGLAGDINADKLEELMGEKIKTFTAFDEIIKRGTILPAFGEKIVTAEPGTFKIPICIAQDKDVDKKIYKVLGDYEYYLPIPEEGVEAEEGEEIKIKFTLKDNETLDVTAEDIRTGETLKLEAKTKKKGEKIKRVIPQQPPKPPDFPKPLIEVIKKMGWEGFNAVNKMQKATNLVESGFVRDVQRVKNAIGKLNGEFTDVINNIFFEATTKVIEREITLDPNDPAVEDALCEIISREVEISERDKERIKRKTADLVDVMVTYTPIEKAIESANEAIYKAEVKLQEPGIRTEDRRKITTKKGEVEDAIRDRGFRQIMHRTTELENMTENL